jgi:hypothetical protein
MELFDYKKFVAERKAKAESQARDYFYNKKERKPYYWAEGNTLDDVCNHNEAFFHFTTQNLLSDAECKIRKYKWLIISVNTFY